MEHNHWTPPTAGAAWLGILLRIIAGSPFCSCTETLVMRWAVVSPSCWPVWLKLRAVFRSFCDVSHMTQLVLHACCGRGAPGQAPHSRDKTNSLMNCHHHNHQHLAQALHTPSKERGRKQYFRSEYFGLCEVSNLNAFPFQVSNLNELWLISSQDVNTLGVLVYHNKN